MSDVHFLVGCSFTDPLWQTEIPWSVEYSKTHACYMVAKAGMGIKGICTEAMYYLPTLPKVSKVVIVLPTLWRMDIEVDTESYLCNAMVDLLYANSGNYEIVKPAQRKWISSGGLHYNRKTEQAKIFDLLYKHQGFLVLAKEHFRSLKLLLNYCKEHKISYAITAIKDPLDQLQGLDYIQNEILTILDDVEYKDWLRFDNKFIDKFLEHD